MTRWPDEEPDVDEPDRKRLPFDEWLKTIAGLCSKCGHDDHRSANCPVVTPVLTRLD